MARILSCPLICIVISALVAVSAVTSPGLAARRVVLFEEATNWGCGPCATANPTIDQFLEDYSVAQVVAVMWHVWWPSGSDPYYNHNPAPVQSRVGYYGISAAPSIVIDGRLGAIAGSYGSMQTYVEEQLAIPSPIAINATGAVSVPDSTFSISIDVDVEEALPPGGDYRLFVVLTEHTRHLPSPNGETDHVNIFRHEAAATGEPIDLTVTGLQHFDRSLRWDAAELPDQIQGVVWVQNYATRELVNAATTWPKPEYYLRVAGGTPGAVNDPGTVAVLTRDILNLGSQNDVVDISPDVSRLPAGWTYQYTTSEGTFTGPSTLPLAADAGETITVEIDSHGMAGGGIVELTFTSQNDPGMVRKQRFSKVSNPQVLVLDDDGGQDAETWLLYGLEAHPGGPVSFGLWEDSWGKLTGAELSTAETVFWACGLSYPTLDASDRVAVSDFLAGGANLFVNGQDIGWELNTPSSGNFDQTWYRENLHATFLTDAAGWSLTGVPGDPIGGDLSYTLNSTSQPWPDGVSPLGTGAETSVQYNANHKGVVRWEGGGSRVVYMSHGFEGITSNLVQLLLVERIVDWFGTATGVPGAAPAPVPLTLAQNYPNPFNPHTFIPYSLSGDGVARLAVYDVSGRMVRELVSGSQSAGPHVAVWDGHDTSGRPLAAGTYFYRLEAPGFEATRSMVLVK